MNYKNYVEELKASVNFFELLDFYGIKIDRGHRMPCIFHNGKDNNLGFKDHYFHCFVCGESGDIIKFVQAYFGIDFKEAVEKINRDFNVGLPIGERMSMRDKYRIIEAKEKRERDKLEREKQYQLLLGDLDLSIKKWEQMNEQFEKYKPAESVEALHPLFVEALQMREYWSYRIGVAESRLREWN